MFILYKIYVMFVTYTAVKASLLALRPLSNRKPGWWSYPSQSVPLPQEAQMQMACFCLLLLKTILLIIRPLITIINGRWTVGFSNCTTVTAGKRKLFGGRWERRCCDLHLYVCVFSPKLEPNLRHSYKNLCGSVSGIMKNHSTFTVELRHWVTAKRKTVEEVGCAPA